MILLMWWACNSNDMQSQLDVMKHCTSSNIELLRFQGYLFHTGTQLDDGESAQKHQCRVRIAKQGGPPQAYLVLLHEGSGMLVESLKCV